jgi:hypothetical protein
MVAAGARFASNGEPPEDVFSPRRHGSQSCTGKAHRHEVLFQYRRAAKELRKLCNLTDVEFTARRIHDNAAVDWGDRGAPTAARESETHIENQCSACAALALRGTMGAQAERLI